MNQANNQARNWLPGEEKEHLTLAIQDVNSRRYDLMDEQELLTKKQVALKAQFEFDDLKLKMELKRFDGPIVELNRQWAELVDRRTALD